MNKAIIIVAGGSGSRMQSELPKQFLLLKNKPILMHTIEVFYKFDDTIKIVLVLPKHQIPYWNDLCFQFSFEIKVDIISGGETRFHSVKNGLTLVDDNSIVGVHDGVRPLVSIETLLRCYSTAIDQKAVVPVTDSIESIRKVDAGMSESVDRSLYKMVQTPQVFHSTILKDSYNQEYKTTFTDDASVVERSGYTIKLVDGNRENIKITTPMDLKIGECLLS